ncbi:hypothetical protein OSB04_009844 [Centaurea solstitialis]|uniref:Pectinesterase inhibitor domain-containing protein n=1 Tax=Centaurea solstitialis TaxID=347529 RepID=A0AA38WK28_9ASTR|nr:hypothetical protein OSB04_009844 [Centaurea solstitialis]
MAFSFQFSSICVVLLAFLFTTFPFPIQGELVEEVCDKTVELKAICIEILRNDSRSSSGNLEVLSKIAIDTTVQNATGLSSYIHSLANKVTDPQVKVRVLRCVVKTDDAFLHITLAKQLVETKQYKPAKEEANLANFALSTCDNSFLLPPVIEPIELKQATNSFRVTRPEISLREVLPARIRERDLLEAPMRSRLSSTIWEKHLFHN